MTLKPEGEGASTSSLLLLPRTSLASPSPKPPQLDKSVLAQTLDQIHHTASQTESLTTFNEYTAPPPVTSGTDGKGIASELQGGLSGLYSRIRASVGTVRDIVTHAHDESADDKSLKSPTASTTRIILDAGKVSSPDPTTPTTIRSFDTVQKLQLGRPAPEVESIDKEQLAKQSRLSSGVASAPLQNVFIASSIPPVPLAPLVQAVAGAAPRSGVAEVNMGATKEREASGDKPPISANNPLSQKATVSLRPENYLGDKKNSRITEASRTMESSGNSYKFQASRATSEGSGDGARRTSDKNTSRDTEAAWNRRSGADKDLTFQNSNFDGIHAPVQTSARPQSITTRSANDSPRIIMNPVASRDDPFQDGSTGGKKDGSALETSKEIHYQHLELPAHRSAPSPQNKQPGARERRSQLNPPFQIAVKTPLASPELKPPANSQQDDDPKSMVVFSQIKSKILNKEYWMRDENARDCFYCGDPFTTFRRKHHCSKYLVY